MLVTRPHQIHTDARATKSCPHLCTDYGKRAANAYFGRSGGGGGLSRMLICTGDHEAGSIAFSIDAKG
jgi:hypothetical protein